MSTAVKINLASQTLTGNSAAILAALAAAGLATTAAQTDAIAAAIAGVSGGGGMVTKSATVTKIVPGTPASVVLDFAAFHNYHSSNPLNAIGGEISISPYGASGFGINFVGRDDSIGGGGVDGNTVYVRTIVDGDGNPNYSDTASSVCANFFGAIAALSPANIAQHGVFEQNGYLDTADSGSIQTLAVTCFGVGSEYLPSYPDGFNTMGGAESGTREAVLLAGVAGKIPRLIAIEALTAGGDPWVNNLGIFAKSADGTIYRGPLLLSGAAPAAGVWVPLPTALGSYIAQPGDSLVFATCDSDGTRTDEATGTGATVTALTLSE